MPVCPSVFSTTVDTMDFQLDVCVFLGGQESVVSSGKLFELVVLEKASTSVQTSKFRTDNVYKE